MTYKEFLISLSLTVGFTFLITFLLLNYETFEKYKWFSYLSLTIFTLFNIFLFTLAYFSVSSKNSYTFITIVMASIFLKILLAFGIIFYFVKMYEPTDSFYLIPFGIMYVVFSSFEIYYMQKMAKMKF